MGATPIEWTDHSINPLRASLNGRKGHYCEKVSPGCKHCYSSKMQRRFGMPEFQEQRGSDVLHFLDADKLREVLTRRKPTKWFWCDMSDMFGAWVPFEWIAACFGVMAATPQHTHQVLTKRPERALEFFRWLPEHAGPGIPFGGDATIPSERLGSGTDEVWNARSWAEPVVDERLDIRSNRDDPTCMSTVPWPLPNVWLGTTCEDQARYNDRWTALHQCPAAVRFLSLEPLLEPVELLCAGCGHNVFAHLAPDQGGCSGAFPDWVIVGGESGRLARPFHLDWAESLQRQCSVARIAYFLKQLGAKPIGTALDGPCPYDAPFPVTHKKGGDINEFPEHLRLRQFPEDHR